MLGDHQILQHVKGVSIRLHRDHALLLAVHLEKAVVIQAYHLSLQSVLTPESHLSPTEVKAQRATVTVVFQDVIVEFRTQPSAFSLDQG